MACLLYYFMSFTTIGEPADKRGLIVQEIKSDHQLYQLSLAIVDFHRKHGRYPVKWSEMINEEIDAKQVGVFYSSSNIVGRNRPRNWMSNLSNVDQYSDYEIAPADLPEGVLASEKPGL